MQIRKQISFQVQSDLRCLEQVLAQLEQINEPWLSKEDWLESQLALVEGFTNAVRHAHKDYPSNVEIAIDITLTKKQIKIQIWDHGPPFDLESFLASGPRTKYNLSSGGRGIKILQKIADHLSYVRTDDNRNCLLIVKNLSS